jgi:integration host factor subunit alpha
MALTKADMAESLFNELGLNKREARELVDMYFEELRASLAVGEQVKLSGFGNFDLRDKKERPGRNPKTGEEIPITARRVVTFRPGQKLKARVEAYAGTGGYVQAGTKTKGPSRSICWNRGITTNYLQYLASATSRLVK